MVHLSPGWVILTAYRESVVKGKNRSCRKTFGWSENSQNRRGVIIPFELQLLAAYWALTETEQLTVGHDVLLRPGIPIMNWILSAPASHKIGHAPKASIMK